ncbi:(2Fe-2S)-binding protein [Caballeronia sordidicola]|jgi:predicted molibdopterin-dependent oxidoreductase YjgC|nr:(2Fe-2S)-binding protein [Caballeronia sordidicola]
MTNLPSATSAGQQQSAADATPQFVRLTEAHRKEVGITVDGEAITALTGDTVLSAILLHTRRVRDTEFSGEPRAGFCLMGACQDCWVQLEEGTRIRACSTFVKDGMRVLTRPSGVIGA